MVINSNARILYVKNPRTEDIAGIQESLALVKVTRMDCQNPPAKQEIALFPVVN